MASAIATPVAAEDAPGLAAGLTGELPVRTREFMTFCDRDWKLCGEEVFFQLDAAIALSLSVVEGAHESPLSCVRHIMEGQVGSRSRPLAEQVSDWLHRHPETHDLPTLDGMTAALDALYPCD
jgi:hypothetical protein